jgi:hypothetical protein
MILTIESGNVSGIKVLFQHSHNCLYSTWTEIDMDGGALLVHKMQCQGGKVDEW